MKLNTLKFALAGGIWFALVIVIATLGSMFKVPGFPAFTQMMVDFYGPWGYSVSNTGILVGAVGGFLDGFVSLGIFAVIYNKLVGRKK